MIMLKEKRLTLRIFSRVLAAALISSVVVGIPSANADLPSPVSTEAEFLTALADNAIPTITLTNSIALTAPITITRAVTINGVERTRALTGKPISINASGLAVTFTHLTLSGTENLQPEGNYGVMVQAGTFTADDIALTVDGSQTDQNNVGFNVAASATLSMTGSTITVNKKQQAGAYVVYAQSGATSVTLTGNTISMPESVAGQSGFTHLFGTEGTLPGTVVLTPNTSDAEISMLFTTALFTDAKTAGQVSNRVATGGKIRILNPESAVFSKLTDTSWAEVVGNDADLRIALGRASAQINLSGSIALASALSISRTVVIDGISRANSISGKPITVTVGAVTLKNLTLTGTENLQPEGNYGVMIQSGSLTATNIALTVDGLQENPNNVGFNVATGVALTVSGSTITINKKQQAGAYVAYAQSGATSVTIGTSTITMPESVIGQSGYTHIIGSEGTRATLSLSGNTSDAEIAILYADDIALIGVDQPAAVTAGLIAGDKIRRLAAPAGIFSNIDATHWAEVVKNDAELRTALTRGSEQIQLANSIVLASALNLTGTKTIDGIARTTVLSGKPITVTSGATVFKNVTLTGTENLQPEGNYGIMIQGGSFTATNIAITVDGTQTDPNNVGFNVAASASLNISGSTITVNKKQHSGAYVAYAQSTSTNVTITGNTITMPESVIGQEGYTHLLGTEGTGPTTVLISGNTSDAEIALLVATGDSLTAQTYAVNTGAVAVGGKLRTLASDAGIFIKVSNTVWTPTRTVTYALGGGSGTIPGQADVGVTASFTTLSSSGITRSGYSFSKWSDGTADFAAEATYTMASANVTLTATWTVNAVAPAPAPVVVAAAPAAAVTYSAQTAVVVVPLVATIQLRKTTQLGTSGGSGIGNLTYSTTTPTICSVTVDGLVTGVAAGTCSITATKAASGYFLAATSVAVVLTMSDTDDVAQAVADKVVADKAAADAAVVKAAEEKAAADKAAADAAALESGGGAPIAKEDLNSIRYAIATKTKSIFIDLADMYADAIALVEVKKFVLKNGKNVLSYVPVDTVSLGAYGRAVIKTLVGIKVGNVIRVSIVGESSNTPIKYVTVK